MNEDVLLRLAIAKQYAHHANFAGTPREAIADGYSAVDAMLSALLVHNGQELPKNHKQKFEEARKLFPKAFAAESVQRGNAWSFAPGADWVSLKARYHGGTIPLFGVPWSKVLDGVLSCASDVLKRKTSDHADPKQETITAS